MIRDPSDGAVREKLKKWRCTDCEDTFNAAECERCTMCGGARVIGPVAEEPSVLSSPPMITGLPPEKAKQAARLAESRAWLKQYFEPKA